MNFHLLDIQWFPDKSSFTEKNWSYINLTFFQIEDFDGFNPASLLSVGWWDGKFYFDILFSDLIRRKIEDWRDR